jgi:hypothetical protein
VTSGFLIAKSEMNMWDRPPVGCYTVTTA